MMTEGKNLDLEIECDDFQYEVDRIKGFVIDGRIVNEKFLGWVKRHQGKIYIMTIYESNEGVKKLKIEPTPFFTSFLDECAAGVADFDK